MTKDIKRINYLIDTLNKASEVYYNSEPAISDYEWDKMYDELKALEEQTGIIYNNSPTQNVGYTVAEDLEEVIHNHPMLSLDKTKSIDELRDFAGNRNCFLSVKCDGLTTSLYYSNGKLTGAETRGDGVRGVNVLQNVLTIKNIPHTIPYTDELIIDGETIIGWDSFRKINEPLPEDKKYKHPRNLVSGSLQLFDSAEAAERNMRFIAWRVIKGFEHKSVFKDLKRAEELGFEIVPMYTYSNSSEDSENLPDMLESLREASDKYNIPYDGAVMATDDYKIAESMGRTETFFRHSIAYKYEDELFETTLRDIEWNTSKTGLINPVAIFDPVNLSGAITTRATLHNITYIKDMRLGIGDRIRIYRSNMVIPKVHDSIDKSGDFTIPDKCPICGGETKIVKENDSEVLICTNPDCKGKLLGKLTHAVSKNALDLDGLSKATIQKFINLGWLSSIKDIYHLSDYKSKMSVLEGFGTKSVNKLMKSIEDSRHTTFDRFLCSLSIPMVGKAASKAISNECDGMIGKFIQIMLVNHARYFKRISGIDDSLVKSLDDYFEKHYEEMWELSQEFKFNVQNTKKNGTSLSRMSFVITGSLNKFKNRDALKEKIESLGGKVAGSVSSKTTALINNDVKSTSSKNKKAKSLGVPILSEDNFIEKYLGGDLN